MPCADIVIELRIIGVLMVVQTATPVTSSTGEMYEANNSGPSTEPWGTPGSTCVVVDDWEKIFTKWLRFLRYEVIHRSIPKSYCNLSSRFEWQIVYIESQWDVRSDHDGWWLRLLCSVTHYTEQRSIPTNIARWGEGTQLWGRRAEVEVRIDWLSGCQGNRLRVQRKTASAPSIEWSCVQTGSTAIVNRNMPLESPNKNTFRSMCH